MAVWPQDTACNATTTTEVAERAGQRQFCPERKVVSVRDAGHGQTSGQGETRRWEGTEKGQEVRKGQGYRRQTGREIDGKENTGDTRSMSRKESLHVGGSGRDWTGFTSFPSHASTYLFRRSLSNTCPSCFSSFIPYQGLRVPLSGKEIREEGVKGFLQVLQSAVVFSITNRKDPSMYCSLLKIVGLKPNF